MSPNKITPSPETKMFLLVFIAFSSLVKIRAANVDLIKRDATPLETILEFEWKNKFLLFRLQEQPISVYLDGQIQPELLFKAQSDDGIQGVFILNNNIWQGSFDINGTVYHAFPSNHPRAIIKRDNFHHIQPSDHHNFSCQTNTTEIKSNQFLTKRTDVTCPLSLQILPTCVAVDCNYYKTFQNQTSANILQEVGLASLILEKNINVGLGVLKIDIRSTCDNGQDAAVWNNVCSTDVNAKLSSFTQWAGQQSEQCGIWHLITQCAYNPTLGIAWINTVCNKGITQQGSTFVGNTGLSSVNTDGFKIMSHEIMHNLGASHDCSAASCVSSSCSNNNNCGCCPCENCDCKSAFLMNPSLTTSTTISPCTKNDVCGALPFMGTCLQAQQPQLTFQPIAFCGNGIVENNEECDPGASEDPCCTAQCKLKTNAKCSDANHGCCTNCTISANLKSCRSSIGECDIQETCDGTSYMCPIDKYKDNGSICSQGRCSKGICTNPNDQCHLKSSRLGYKLACSNDCRMLCSSSAGVCTDMNTNFLPGTSCKVNGKCSKDGVCEFDNSSDAILSWISSNAVVVGLISTVLLVAILYIGVQLRRNRKIENQPPTPLR